MTVLMFNDKADLITALEATRPFYEKADAKAVKEHAAKEQRALKDFRARCQKAAMLTYDQLKNDVDKWDDKGRFSRITFDDPSCPRSQVANLDAALARLGLTGQSRFNIERTGRWGDLWSLLNGPIDAASSQDLCA